eukprot:Lithocolla_globosa_v1_NODE_1893_length_2270_cov_14.511061.p1 type:complete len:663 gc:universal NODE_1893_length_2270_cov_14.511061:2153-165(-)
MSSVEEEAESEPEEGVLESRSPRKRGKIMSFSVFCERLMQTLSSNDPEEITKVLEERSLHHFSGCEKNGVLHMAALTGNSQVLSLLLIGHSQLGNSQSASVLNSRFDINHKDSEGATCLHRLLLGGGDVSAGVSLLLESGADVNARDHFRCAPLHYAARHGCSRKTLQVLISHGACREARDYDGKTALHFAVACHPESARWLLALGCSPNAQDNNGCSPLHVAAMKDQASVIAALVSHGASVEAGDEFLRTPLHVAVLGAQYPKVDQKVVLTTGVHTKGGCVQALLAQGCDVNARDHGHSTPLLLAASKGHTQITALLLRHGANINAPNVKGWTALFCAFRNGHRETLDLLLEQGSESAHAYELCLADSAARKYPFYDDFRLILQKHKDKAHLHCEIKGLKEQLITENLEKRNLREEIRQCQLQLKASKEKRKQLGAQIKQLEEKRRLDRQEIKLLKQDAQELTTLMKTTDQLLKASGGERQQELNDLEEGLLYAHKQIQIEKSEKEELQLEVEKLQNQSKETKQELGKIPILASEVAGLEKKLQESERKLSRHLLEDKRRLDANKKQQHLIVENERLLERLKKMEATESTSKEKICDLEEQRIKLEGKVKDLEEERLLREVSQTPFQTHLYGGPLPPIVAPPDRHPPPHWHYGITEATYWR